MKLQNKVNIRFLLVTLVVFAAAGVLFYFALGHVVDQNIREMLSSRKENVLLYLKNNENDKIVKVSPDHFIFIKPIAYTHKYSHLSDTIAFDLHEKKLIPFRKLVFSAAVGTNYYEVTILQSLLESEDLQAIIIYFMVSLFLLILLAIFFTNKWLSGKAWKPFFRSSSLLKSWKIGENKPVHFDHTGISEFDQMNSTLEEMIAKMQVDFVNLKEFTENASHELQTPLAIIKSKLELMLNDAKLTVIQRKQLHEIFQTIIRLSKLNEALLLLSKIENKQFVDPAEVDLCGLIRARISYAEELFELKHIELSFNLDIPMIISIHPTLAEILVNNLISNALNHNTNPGRFNISSQKDEIVFSNTGNDGALDSSRIFKRFVKGSKSDQSNGLGLAIVNEICAANHLKLEYSWCEQLHCFSLSKA
jgi:signal transduction histidine kinase